MLELREYQRRCLNALKDFFHLCGTTGNPAAAFTEVAGRIFNPVPAYHDIPDAAHLQGIPYVCLRVPTGGGKTLMACHAIPSAVREYKQVDDSLVLWLVPSNTILDQTYAALSNPEHPYRQALDSLLGGVTVMKVKDALHISRGDVDGRTCIILSTVQAFRRDDKEGLKVYDPGNGSLQEFFDSASVNAFAGELELDPKTKTTAKSLANVIAMRHPVVIVDEAHNARTLLSFSVLNGFHPSCILEFTATPDTKNYPSNVLYSVSANELKSEYMIKLPIMVEGCTDSNWRALLQRAINRRNKLEKTAELERQTTGEYIRPIMLLQAQRKSQASETFHAERLRELLTADFRIPENQIKIATGDKREIDGVDLFAPDCEVRYIITQQALKEGWDCSFAYVLCSIFETGSKIEVEQILGRVLRMPHPEMKREKVFKDLNCAYAFAPARFDEIANSLKDALTQNGFNKFEAEQLIQQGFSYDADDLFGNTEESAEPDEFEFHVAEDAPKVALPHDLRHKVELKAETKTVVLKGRMSVADRESLKKAFPASVPEIDRAFTESNRLVSQFTSPAERGEPFSIPRLAVQYDQQELELFDETAVLEYPMDISALDANLPEYKPNNGYIQIGKVDSEDNKITTEVIQKIQQDAKFFDTVMDCDWTAADLVRHIDNRIDHSDITAANATAFFARVVSILLTERAIPIDTLVVDRFRLLELLRQKLNKHRTEAAKKAYQDLLLPDFETPLCVTDEFSFQFGETYPASDIYRGGYKFKKHYYPVIGSFDGKEGGEEELCAQHIDQMDEVEYWVRNLDSRPDKSLWFQLHKNKFYPDFVCKLKDGRILAVEHKGKDRISNEDSTEKRTIGEIWMKRSAGKCLFIMTTEKNFDAIDALVHSGGEVHG